MESLYFIENQQNTRDKESATNWNGEGNLTQHSLDHFVLMAEPRKLPNIVEETQSRRSIYAHRNVRTLLTNDSPSLTQNAQDLALLKHCPNPLSP